MKRIRDTVEVQLSIKDKKVFVDISLNVSFYFHEGKWLAVAEYGLARYAGTWEEYKNQAILSLISARLGCSKNNYKEIPDD